MAAVVLAAEEETGMVAAAVVVMDMMVLPEQEVAVSVTLCLPFSRDLNIDKKKYEGKLRLPRPVCLNTGSATTLPFDLSAPSEHCQAPLWTSPILLYLNINADLDAGPVTDYGATIVHWMRYRQPRYKGSYSGEAERPSVSYIVNASIVSLLGI